MRIFTRAFVFDRQPSPINHREIVNDIFAPLFGVTIRMPGSDQIVNIMDGESGIPGAHQLYGLERDTLAVDKWLATFIEA